MSTEKGAHSGLDRTHVLCADLFRAILREESGQDLIEYALICCFIALGAVASMKSLVAAILAVVTSVGSTLTAAT